MSLSIGDDASTTVYFSSPGGILPPPDSDFLLIPASGPVCKYDKRSDTGGRLLQEKKRRAKRSEASKNPGVVARRKCRVSGVPNVKERKYPNSAASSASGDSDFFGVEKGSRTENK